MLDTDDDGGARLTVPNAYLIDRTGVSFRNQLIQDFGDARGSLFQARLDGEQDIGGFLSSFKAGLRYAKRTATRSEEHTSELQSLMRISYAVFCLKKKNKQIT